MDVPGSGRWGGAGNIKKGWKGTNRYHGREKVLHTVLLCISPALGFLFSRSLWPQFERVCAFPTTRPVVEKYKSANPNTSCISYPIT